ncbi:MAG: hypothetical protein EOO27_03090 [Comamonadaceae bacterium]|nr:MAG: hypothetical protein EOO27_03090 [Comamonadaceae bacterium]
MSIESTTSIDQRKALDSIAEMAMRIVNLLKANPARLNGAPLAEINVLARLIGLTADSTDSDAGANLNDVWGVVEVDQTAGS